VSDEPAALGPKPLEVRAVALSGTRRAVLAILLARTEPVSISVVASAIEGHDNSARAHLDALADAGLAERTIAPAQGRGRPRYLYAAAPGSASALAEPEAIAGEYHALVGAFAAHVQAEDGESAATARRIGRSWGAALVDSSPRQESEDANRQVINLLARLGFSPEATPDGAIALRTCPLLELAQAHPDVICQVHAGLTEGAHLAFGGDGEGVGLTAFAAPGACHLRLPARP